MSVKNEVKTVRGLFVSTNPDRGAEKVEFVNDDENTLNTLNALVGAEHGAVITLSRGVFVWVDEDGKTKKKGNNIKLSILTGRPVYGAGVLIGSEPTADGQGTILADLPADMFDHLVGH